MPRCCCCCCGNNGNTNNNTGAGSAGVNPVGTVIYAHILQPGYVKANGQLLSRRDYPDLYRYAFDNRLILSEADWANEMQGMFAAGDRVNTFRVPDLRGQFLRGLDDDAGIDVGRIMGSTQGDAIRNVKGQLSAIIIPNTESATNTGPFSASKMDSLALAHYMEGTDDGWVYKSNTMFDVSKAVPTAEENRPKNIALIAQIKY